MRGRLRADPAEASGGYAGVGAGYDRLEPVPCVHPALPHWEEVLSDAATRGAPAVRCDPHHLGLAAAGDEMRVLAAACGAAKLPLLMAVRLEDGRQRHPHDVVPELAARSAPPLLLSAP